MKGALVEYTTAFTQAVPNVIVFQFNPETLRRTWTQQEATRPGGDPLGVPGVPGESYSLTLLLDSDDADRELRSARPRAGLPDVVPDDPSSAADPDYLLFGLGSRLAALEMLLFPARVAAAEPPVATGGGAAVKAKSSRPTPTAVIPPVLFVWGPNRILPVRITALTITETLFDAFLRPTAATVELAFRVMTAKELGKVSEPFKTLGLAAYNFAQSQREGLALLNLRQVSDVPDFPPIPGA